MVVGRDPACDWVIDLPMVSSRHALLTRRDGQVLIKDLGSSNGTFVNGRRIEGEMTVYNGDLIGLGSHTLALAIESPAADPGADSNPGTGTAPRPGARSRCFG